MSGLYNKDYFNTNSKYGGAPITFNSNRNWQLLFVILLVFVVIIIDVATKLKTDTDAQKAMVGLWAGMLGIFLILTLYTIGGQATKAKRNTQIVMLVFILLDLLWACVLLAISSPDLSGKEKGVLYGRLIVLYSIPIFLSVLRLLEINKCLNSPDSCKTKKEGQWIGS